MKRENIIYTITTQDINEVAQQSFDRNPTKNELKFVEQNIGDHIAWFEIIENLLNEFNSQSEQKREMRNPRKRIPMSSRK